MRRRGIALLLVLAIVAVTLTGLTLLVRSHTTRMLSVRLNSHEQLLDEVRTVAESLAERWLAEDAAQAVASLEIPSITVLEDRIPIGEDKVIVSIIAFDRQGMLSMEAAKSVVGSRALARLSPGVKARLETIASEARRATGLDDLAQLLNSNSQVYPSADDKSPAVEAIGAFIAMPASGVENAININTAPARLLEAVMRDLGRGGIEELLEARDQGAWTATTNLAPGAEETSGGGDGFRLTDASSGWSFRIDLEIEGLRRSWWLVYDLEQGRDGQLWRRTQRLAIDH